MHAPRPSLLCVEDDARRLEGYQRLLAPCAEVLVARQASEALQAFRARPVAAALVDLRLPLMDGLSLLAQFQRENPLCTRLLMIPPSAADEATRAQNDQRLWRFLLKPLQDATLLQTAELALRQHCRQAEDEEQIERTLHGCIRLLTDLGGRAQPEAFGRAHRLRGHMAALARELNLGESWPFEFAGMLSQIGRLCLAPALQDKLARGEELSPNEQRAFESHPLVAAELLREVPRLEPVARIVALQNVPLAELPALKNGLPSDATGLGGAMLKAVLDFDTAVRKGDAAEAVLERMLFASGKYDARVIKALKRLEAARRELRRTKVSFAELDSGMILVGDLRTLNGMLILPKGQELSAAALPRIQRFAENYGVVEPIEVLAPARLDDPQAPLPAPRPLATDFSASQT